MFFGHRVGPPPISVFVIVLAVSGTLIFADQCVAQGGCTRNGQKWAIAMSKCPMVGGVADCPEIVQANSNMEVAEPYLNPCSGFVPRERWASNVLWLFNTDPDGVFDGVAEIGWRKICTSGGGAKRVFFFAVSRNGTVNEEDYIAGLTPQVGATYEFSLEAENDSTGTWKGKITGPGLGDGFQQNKVLSGFDSAMYIEAGGENYYEQNDMGVVGHKDVRFKLSSGVRKTLITEPFTIESTSPRYDIIASHNYFQTRSDIHLGTAPTPVATRDICAPGW